MSAARSVFIDSNLPHGMSPADRIEYGRARRSKVPRSALGQIPDGSERADPLELLKLQAQYRVPELVPIRYGRMAATSFSYLRGAALVMTDDLSRTPNSGLTVPLCGDAHLSNFGIFATPERNQTFDLNDFDETHPGPFEWDVKRLAASVAVSSLSNGFSADDARAAAQAAAHGYRKALWESTTTGNLDTWYKRVDMDAVLKVVRKKLDVSATENTLRTLKKARNRTSSQALAKLTEVVDGRARIRSDPPLLVPADELFPKEYSADLRKEVERRLSDYRETLQPELRLLFDNFSLVEVARKVVGVGSVGTRTWIALLTGAGTNDPLFLQVKEAPPSVISDYVKGYDFTNQGERVVNGQRLLQASSDIFLGWQSGLSVEGRECDFYVRQLRDGKGSVVIEALGPEAMLLYSRLCGQTLAHAHARSGDRFAIAGYMGKNSSFDKAIATYAMAYTKRTELDHAQLVDAISDGVVTAENC